MALRVLLSERYGAEEPPWHGGGKVMSRPLTYRGAQSTYQTRVQRANNANSRTGSLEHPLPF